MVDDEISLFDIYAILVRRRRVIIGTVLVAFAVAVAYMLTRAPQYQYRAPLEIARAYIPETGLVPVEAPESVAAKIEYGHGGVSARVKGEIVIITATGPDPAVLVEQVEGIAGKIGDRHDRWDSTLSVRTQTRLIGDAVPHQAGMATAGVLAAIAFGALWLGAILALAVEFIVRAGEHVAATAR